MSGTVTLDDGTPIASGRVVFETEDGSFSAVGAIVDGHYTMGIIADDDGIPRGDYIVYITSATRLTGETIEVSDGIDSNTGEDIMMTLPLLESVVAEKYTSVRDSPLRCKVTRSMTFDIVVPPYVDESKKDEAKDENNKGS